MNRTRPNRIEELEKEIDSRLSCGLELFGIDDELLELKKQENIFNESSDLN